MVSIKKYNKKLINQWDDFVSLSNNGTIFSNRSFLNYHINRSFKDCSLLFYHNQKIVAVLPAAIQNNSLCSHPGASYGGIILSNNIAFKTINLIVDKLNLFCFKKNFTSIVLIVCPQTYFLTADESLNYILERSGYNIKERYVSHITDINATKDVKTLLTKRKRRYINNSSDSGQFKFQETSSFGAFYKILLNVKKKYSTKPTHSLNELKKIKKLFPKKCMLIVSKLNNKTVGGTFLLFVNKKVCLVFYNVVLDTFRNSQLSAYQLYNCMFVVKNLNYKLIDFGVSQNPESLDPLSPKMSLIQFKEHFGARGAMRTIYMKEFKND